MKKLLLIEDTEDIRENLAEILTLEGFEVRTAENGLDGFLKLTYFQPDLIITDLIMPKMDGAAFIKKVKAIRDYCDIPVIVLSAFSAAEDDLKNQIQGSEGFLRKPCSTDIVLEMIHRILQSPSN